MDIVSGSSTIRKQKRQADKYSETRKDIVEDLIGYRLDPADFLEEYEAADDASASDDYDLDLYGIDAEAHDGLRKYLERN